MNDAGLLHFDAHVGNIRTDGHHLFLSDLGLAPPRFDLTTAESTFIARHRAHDVIYALTHLVNWWSPTRPPHPP